MTFQQWITLIGALAAILAAMAACLNVLAAMHVFGEISQLKVELNSRLSELLNLTRNAAFAEGQVAGRQEGEKR